MYECVFIYERQFFMVLKHCSASLYCSCSVLLISIWTHGKRNESKRNTQQQRTPTKCNSLSMGVAIQSHWTLNYNKHACCASIGLVYLSLTSMWVRMYINVCECVWSLLSTEPNYFYWFYFLLCISLFHTHRRTTHFSVLPFILTC